jgi:hypothetical protein
MVALRDTRILSRLGSTPTRIGPRRCYGSNHSEVVCFKTRTEGLRPHEQCEKVLLADSIGSHLRYRGMPVSDSVNPAESVKE